MSQLQHLRDRPSNCRTVTTATNLPSECGRIQVYPGRVLYAIRFASKSDMTALKLPDVPHQWWLLADQRRIHRHEPIILPDLTLPVYPESEKEH